MMCGLACLDEHGVLALVEGRLDPQELARADAHLDQCEDCRALVMALHRAERGEEAETDAESSPGTSFGRFVVLEPVGAGAMGVVYSAYDPELDRRVALKVIRADAGATSEAAKDRLVGEAQAMARLSHPNVVTIYDVGTTRGVVFIAMELVEGATLRGWCEQRVRPWREIRELCVQAGRGLAAAHAVGLIHRDYKPDNVLVGVDRARVGDFGLAMALHSEPTMVEGSEALAELGGGSTTRTGGLVGTPAYMSPEQLASGRPDARSDQYAFCVASYEALCGTHPFPASTIAGLVERIESGRVEPSTREVPRWLLAALIRGLQRRPEDRFPAMDALLVAMQRDRRRRAGLRGVGVVMLIVGASAGAYGVGVRSESALVPCGGAEKIVAEVWDRDRADEVGTAFARARPRYGRAVADSVGQVVEAWSIDWARGHTEACEATHMRHEQSDALLDARMVCLSGQRRELEALVTRFVAADSMVVDRALAAAIALPDVEACADLDSIQATVPSPGDPELSREVASIREGVADTWAMLRTGEQERGAREAEGLRTRALKTEYQPVIAEVQLVVAHAARQRGEFDRARETALASLWAAQESRHDRLVARAWTALLEIEGGAGEYPSAARYGRHAMASVARLGSPMRLEAPLRNAMGVVLDNLGRYEEAAGSLSRALELRRAQFGAESPELARVLTNLGNLARNRREYDDALTRHRAALAIDQRAYGDDHPEIGRHLHNIARVLLLTGSRDEALDHYLRALTAKVIAFGPMHLEVGRTHNSLGLLFAAEGEAEEARGHYERALAIYTPSSHPERGIVLYNIGLQHAEVGEHGDALRSYEAARPLVERGVGEESRRYAELTLAIADARLALGEVAAARAGYEAAQPLVAALGDALLVSRVEAGLAASVGGARVRPRVERGRRSKRAQEPVAELEPSEPVPQPGAYAPAAGWDDP